MPVSRRQVLRAATGLGLATTGLPLLSGCRGGESAPTAREGPSSARVYRIGWLAEGPLLSGTTPLGSPSPPSGAFQRFIDRLTELGYVEGRTLHWEYRRAIAEDQLAAAATELVALDVDLIVVLAAPRALRAAFGAPGSTPVVMCAATDDPVGQGYAQSLARPGGKVTGVTNSPPFAVFTAKRIDVFQEVLPTLTRLGVLLDVGEENPFQEVIRTILPPNARAQGIALIWEEVRALEELDRAYAALAHAGVDGVFPSTRLAWASREPMARLFGEALRHRLPMSGWNRSSAEAGALVAHGPDIPALFGRAAEYVDKVLRGAWPGDLPIEQPAKYELTLNLKTANLLGVTIPPAVLARATEVIQ